MFHKRLTELRIKAALTQQELADKIKISRATYAQYEIGRRHPDYETLQRLADYFEVTIDYLMGRSNAMHSENELTELDKKVLEEFNKLSEEDKEYVAGLILRISKDRP